MEKNKWKVLIKTAGDTSWVSNELRFDSKEEADKYADKLSLKWTAMTEWKSVPAEEETIATVSQQSFPIGYRKSFLKTPILYGKEITILMPNGERRKAQFALVEASEILASHNEENFLPTAGYPEHNGRSINDRNYQDDVHAQQKVINAAENLEPSILISTSRTPSGTPIITKDGIVVSGNNRTMSLKRAMEEYPLVYQQYIDFMREEFSAYGFSKDKIYREGRIFIYKEGHDKKVLKNPILVRFDYDFPEYNTTELSKYNKDTKKSERPVDKALKMGRILNESENCKALISELIGEYEIFSDFYKNHKDQARLRDALVDCNIITKNEVVAYYDERGFTEGGKELIENMLAGLVLDYDALIASNFEGVRRFRGIIIGSLPVVAKNISLGPEWSLKEEINKAVLLESKVAASGLTFFDYLQQGKMFNEDKSLQDEHIIYMNRLISQGRNRFKSSLDGYNDLAVKSKSGNNLFGEPPAKEELYKAYVINVLPDEVKIKIVKNYEQPAVEKKNGERNREIELAKAKASARKRRLRVLTLEQDYPGQNKIVKNTIKEILKKAA